MKSAAHTVLAALTLLGSVACGSAQVAPKAPTTVASLPVAFCQAALQCPGSSPLGRLASENLITPDTTLDGCLEIGEELRDSIGDTQASQWAASLSSNPCMY